MRTTLSLIKADVGSIGGHVAPGRHLIQTVRAFVDQARCDHLISDFHVLTAGDDIGLLMTHDHGAGDRQIHRLVSYSELEYGRIVKILAHLDDRFTVRAPHEPELAATA